MRITAPSAAGCGAGVPARVFLAILLSIPGLASPAKTAEEANTPYTRIAKLATYISAGDTVGALEAFDKNMKNYGTIAEDLGALSAQTDVLCAIDVVSDKEADNDSSDIHHLTLDWYMTLTSREDSGLTERRRQEIAATLQRFRVKSGRNFKDVWRITSLSPEQILAPIAIK